MDPPKIPSFPRLSLLFLLSSSLFALSQAQATPPLGCNGVELSYNLESVLKIRPFVTNASAQAFSFRATATILNSGTSDLLSWAYLIQFRYRELLVSADPAVFTDGDPFPSSTSSSSPTSFSGFPSTDLKYPIETANDLSQIQYQFTIIGTLFGADNKSQPLPTSLSIGDPSFICPPPVLNGTGSSFLSTCCLPDPKFKPNTTINSSADSFLPRGSGDLTIAYDVIQSFPTSYLASVTIANHNPLGRLDNWHLSWEWARREFIVSMKGAYTSVTDPSDCIYGAQGQYYQSFDFSTVQNCQKKPTILDLPATRANDTAVGKIPYCCRNGTILPESMDASQSTSAFQMQVFKMPPDLNRTKLYPPVNFKISGVALNPDYQCGQPVRVSPTQFPDPSGLQSTTSAIASWQVVCNISAPKNTPSKCCVSFSAFYNDSAVPCKTCACGCPASNLRSACSATSPAMLLPSDALLVPFDNRTAKALAWADIKHYNIPNPRPCGDYCGVSINWHINTDYSGGWTARVTLFNWGDVSQADWFAAVEMGKAYDGYEAMYSFNGTAIGNNTIFMQGLPGLNYLVAEADGSNPGDPRVPGKQQSVISFTKKTTPGINVVAGDGFPTKVFFNGDECTLPDVFLTSKGFRTTVGSFVSLLVALVIAVLLLAEQ